VTLLWSEVGKKGNGMAGTGDLRQRNLGLILTEICRPARSGLAPSRSQIARRSGLHKTTVSGLTDELLRAGLIVELSPVAAAQAGRPVVPLAAAPGRLAGLGLEINVEYIGLKALDLTGAVLAERFEAADQRGSAPDQVLDRLASLSLDVVARLERIGTPVVGVGLALPGLTTTGGGQLALLNAPNLGWREVDLRPFERRLGLALRLDNEANLAARAEARLAGPDPAERSFVYLSAEAGIGAGLVADGALMSGLHGWAGEIGHVTVDPTGPVCTCGARGCLEVYAGRRALARAAGLPGSPTPEEILAAFDATSARLAEVTGHLATALSSTLNLLDISQVVLGGDYAVLAPLLAQPLQAALCARVLAARWAGAEVTVRAARAGGGAAMDGAAWTVLDTVLANPSPHL
jgi:predicted NBD/HSP70 family sugar kinase